MSNYKRRVSTTYIRVFKVKSGDEIWKYKKELKYWRRALSSVMYISPNVSKIRWEIYTGLDMCPEWIQYELKIY
jgi:hypothetical protein